jgi:hypothetical protein
VINGISDRFTPRGTAGHCIAHYAGLGVRRVSDPKPINYHSSSDIFHDRTMAASAGELFTTNKTYLDSLIE